MQEIIWHEVPTFYMQITKTLENPVFSRVLFCAVFYCFKEKVAACLKSRLKKLMVVFKTPLKKFALARIIEITTRQGGKNHAKKED